MRAIPKHAFSWEFTMTDGGRTLARLETSWWREKGTLTVEGVEHRAYRESLFGDFVLESGGATVARATKPSAFQRKFVITHNGVEYTLRSHSPFRRSFVVLQGDRAIGSIAPDGVFSRKADVDLPDDLSLPLKAFILWLTVLLWKRDAQAD
jgi:hypothetical protein